MSRKLTTAEFIARARKTHGDRYDYSNAEYKDSATKVAIVCPSHGMFYQLPHSHMQGIGCPSCGGNARPGLSGFIEKAKAVHGDQYTYGNTQYVNMHKKVAITCPTHGDFAINPQSFLRGAGCPACRPKKQVKPPAPPRYSRESFLANARAAHGDAYDYSLVGDVPNTQTHITVVCPRHGAFRITPNCHTNMGQGCRKCSNKGVSKVEQLLVEALHPHDTRNRKLLSGDEIDILVTPTLGVEVNGRYWHTEVRGKDKWYHLRKTEAAADAGVQLLHIEAEEAEQEFDKVVGLIKAKSRQFDRRVYARSLTMKTVGHSDTRDFLQANHMQGACSASVRYGLYAGDELLAIMTFGRPRFSRKYDWELLRFCTVLGTQVVGGASRLFKHFLRNHTGTVVSYANRRWSDGGLYKALGFDSVGVSDPSYMWVRGNYYLSRYQTQKHKLAALLGDRFDEARSEKENMEAAGYSRLWDCGNFVFAYIRNK